MKQRVKLDMTDETYHCSMILCLRIQACKFSPVLIVKFKSFAGKMCGQTSKLRREFFLVRFWERTFAFLPLQPMFTVLVPLKTISFCRVGAGRARILWHSYKTKFYQYFREHNKTAQTSVSVPTNETITVSTSQP